MRTPSSHADLYSDHARHLTGGHPAPGGSGVAVFEDEPNCGWYQMRKVKGGPWVPVHIWCDQDIDPETGDLRAPEKIFATIGGEVARTWRHAWPRCAGRPITEDAYHALLNDEGLTETLEATHVAVDLSEKAVRP